MDQYDIEAEEFENKCHEFLMERGFVFKNKFHARCTYDKWHITGTETITFYSGSNSWCYSVTLPFRCGSDTFSNYGYGKGFNTLMSYVKRNSDYFVLMNLYDNYIHGTQVAKRLIDLYDKWKENNGPI